MLSRTWRRCHGKTACFMPKPIYRRQRLGHALSPIDLEERAEPVFAGNKYVGPVRYLRCNTSPASLSTRKAINGLHQPYDELV